MAERPVETVHVPDEAPPTATKHVPDLPRFGRFQALGELGTGGMGIVYRAHDDVLGRPVAIKVLHARDANMRERFLREAKAIGAVPHPNILAIYDAAADHDVPYLVMELAQGSLRDRLQAGPLAVETVREIGIQIARGLAAAHAAHILHRDIKPGNILIASAGVWKLADFGIARTPDSTLTVDGQFLGSPSYAAPESLRAGEFSTASDVYGLAATLYEALTGAPPHGHDLPSIMRKLQDDATHVSTRCVVPPALANAIMAGLARDPARRPSAEAFAQLLATAHGPYVPLVGAQGTPPHVATHAPHGTAPHTPHVGTHAPHVPHAPHGTAPHGIARHTTNAPPPPMARPPRYMPVARHSNRTVIIVIVAVVGAALAALAIGIVAFFAIADRARVVIDETARAAEQQDNSVGAGSNSVEEHDSVGGSSNSDEDHDSVGGSSNGSEEHVSVTGNSNSVHDDSDESKPSPPRPPAAPVAPAQARTLLEQCGSFQSSTHGSRATATWTGCPDSVVRKIECKPFVHEVRCECLEDGVSRWFFTAPELPNFSTDTANRIGSTSCRMGFGN